MYCVEMLFDVIHFRLGVIHKWMKAVFLTQWGMLNQVLFTQMDKLTPIKR